LALDDERGSWLFYLAPILALACFLVYLLQIRSQPFLEHLVANPLVYDDEARQILRGLPRSQPFFMSPLYPAFVALVYFLTKGSRAAVIFFQGVLLAANVFLIGSVARRLLTRQMAIGASFAAAFYWSFYYFAGEILPTTLFMSFLLVGLLLFLERSEAGLSRAALPAIAAAGILFLVYAMPSLRNLDRAFRGVSLPMPRGSYLGTFAFFVIFTTGAAALLILIRLSARMGRLGNLLTSGLVLGVSMLLWSGAALVIGLLALTLLRERPGRPKKIGLFVIGIMIPLLASLTHNYFISGEVIPVTSSAGVNLYLGNNPTSDGMDPFKFGEANRIKIEANRLVLSGAKRSAYFRGHAYRFIREQPLEWLRLTGKKLLISMGRIEIDNNADISERRSAWRRFFVPVLHFGIIFPLAMAGVVYMFRTKRQAAILLFGYVGFLAVGIIFFVSERFRLPAVAFLVPLAVLGFRGLVGDGLRRNLRALAIPLSTLVVAATVSNIDFFSLAEHEFPSITINKAHVERLSGNHEEARRLIAIAMEEEPGNAGAYFQLGAIEESEGNIELSFGYYLDSLENDPFFYASYAGAKRILEMLRISAYYLDSYMDALVRGGDHVEAKEKLIDFVGKRTP
jgi:tetratricopeptide (TPR) repeat protein